MRETVVTVPETTVSISARGVVMRGEFGPYRISGDITIGWIGRKELGTIHADGMLSFVLLHLLHGSNHSFTRIRHFVPIERDPGWWY